MRWIAVLLADLAIVYGSILLSFFLLKDDFLLDYSSNIGAFYYISPVIAVLYLVIAYVFGMIALQRKSINEIAYTVFIVSTALTISIMAAVFFIREDATSYPRSAIVLSYGFYFFGLIAWRIILQKLYFYWHGRREVLIVGKDAAPLMARLQRKYDKLYSVKYICSEDDPLLLEKAGEVGDIFILDDVVHNVREKLFGLSFYRENKFIYYIPKIDDIAIINSRLFRFDDIPTHAFSKMFLTEEERFVKRVMDVSISLFFLITLAPLYALIAILIKMDGGPVFYTQERLTQGGEKFNVIKFRTMIPDAESASGPTLSLRMDMRITRLGKFLRQTRLDELPQFWNILRGEMSVVGPRPERPYFAEMIEKDVPEFRHRLNVKAGLTGMAQLMGKYNTDFKQKLHYDLYYINNFSIFRDLLLILQTVNIMFWKESQEGIEPVQHDVTIEGGQPTSLKVESKKAGGY